MSRAPLVQLPRVVSLQVRSQLALLTLMPGKRCDYQQGWPLRLLPRLLVRSGTEARSSHVTAGTFGQGVASVQGNITGSVASVSGNVGGNVVGSVGSVTGNVGGSVNSVTNSRYGWNK